MSSLPTSYRSTFAGYVQPMLPWALAARERLMAAVTAFQQIRWLRLESRLGIAPRLGIAFGAVALLAAAANVITEHGDTLIRKIEMGPISEPVIPIAGPVEVPIVVPTPTPTPNRPVFGPETLLTAIERFERAVLARAEDTSAEQLLGLRVASTSLGEVREAYFTANKEKGDDAQLRKLKDQIIAYQRQGVELIALADTRRRLFREYTNQLDDIDARMKATLDRAWKIFGRVVARQSLVDMSRSLDDLRRDSAPLALPRGYNNDTLSAVAASETAVAKILQKNAAGFAASQGDEWVERMRRDLPRLVTLRESLVTTDGEREAAFGRFSQASNTVAALTRKNAAAVAALARKNAATAAALARENAAKAAAAAVREAVPPAAISVVPQAMEVPVQAAADTSVPALPESEHRQRVLLAWLSASVLFLLLAISINTVMSVVMPVRRMLQATRRLAGGDANVTVPRGGIKELDTLAVSFNHMAEQLAAAQAVARQYHGQLEAKVEQRTRELQHLAEHDPLTRLPNRRQLFTQLNAALEGAAAENYLVGVFFLDLDNFKNINDSMGHVFGDRVLQSIAQRLQGAVEPFGFSARLGGDEFTVVYERAANIEEIRAAGTKLVRAFQEPLIVDGRDLLMSISVGASVYPDHAQDAEALLRAADAALFRAKAQGRSQLSVFSPDLLEAAASKFATEQGLRRAVDRGEFELFFQPEVNLRTLETDLVEALLRWRLPNGGYALPSDFLDVAEECGLIREIGEWVLRSAIEHAARWHRTSWPKVRIAVNVSSRQLLDNHFVDTLQALLAKHQLPPECIEIELTENVLQTGHHTIEALRRLRSLGIGVALDDFGTGYSSLVSLEQLPLSRVKLDRGLIASIDTSARSLAIARAIIGLCHSLGLEITAEGVERKEQLTPLVGHAAMYLQGYLLSKPVPANELIPVIAEIPARMRALGFADTATLSQITDHPTARLRRVSSAA